MILNDSRKVNSKDVVCYVKCYCNKRLHTVVFRYLQQLLKQKINFHSFF